MSPNAGRCSKSAKGVYYDRGSLWSFAVNIQAGYAERSLSSRGVIACGRISAGGGDGWHPGIPGERVVQGGEDADAVLSGGGNVAADGVPVPGGLLGAEPAGDLLLDLGRAHVSLSLVRGRGYAQVKGEPEHVVLAVAQAFQQQPGGQLSRLGAGDPPDLGQSDADAVPEQPQVFRFGVGGNGGQILV